MENTNFYATEQVFTCFPSSSYSFNLNIVGIRNNRSHTEVMEYSQIGFCGSDIHLDPFDITLMYDGAKMRFCDSDMQMEQLIHSFE